MQLQLEKESNGTGNLALNTVYKIATRKNINIRTFGQLLVVKLLGLSENTKNPCLRRSQHNIAVRKNDPGRSIRCACKTMLCK